MCIGNSKKNCGLVVFALVAAFGVVAEDLSIKPFFVRDNGVVSMIVRATNGSNSSIMLPTEGYALDVPEGNDLKVTLTFQMPSFEHEKESWSYVPSAQRIGLVELRSGEHGVIQVPLAKGLARDLLDPSASYSVSYRVDASFAKRFGTWGGEVSTVNQDSPFKEGGSTVMLQDDGSSVDSAKNLTFLPTVSAPGLGVGGSAITIDPSTIPKIGDKVTIRPAPGSGLRRRVTGEFGGVAGSMVTVGKRRYYILDIHPSDRKKFVDFADYHRN